MKACWIATACFLGCLSLPGATAACSVGYFECDNGECIDANAYLCNGGDNCGDWSDETVCNRAPEGSLLGFPVNGSAQLLLSVDLLAGRIPYYSGGQFAVALCGQSSCCGHMLGGHDDTSPSASSTFTTIGNTLAMYQHTQQSVFGLTTWLSNNTIEVEKHNRLLAVWPTGRPEFKQWIECPTDATNIVIQPYNSLGSVNILPDSSGNIRPLGPLLDPGESILVKFVLVPYYNVLTKLTVGLCGRGSCAVVEIGEPRSEDGGKMAYNSGIINKSNNLQDKFDVIIHRTLSYKSSAWKDTSYNVSVALHPDGFLQVWQDSDDVAEVPLPEEIRQEPTLRVLSSNGNVAFDSQGVQLKKNLPRLRALTPTQQEQPKSILVAKIQSSLQQLSPDRAATQTLLGEGPHA